MQRAAIVGFMTLALVVTIASVSHHAQGGRAGTRVSLNWEPLDSRVGGAENLELLTYRARVPGGWLVSVVGRVPESGRPRQLRPGEVPASITFMPDAAQEWTR